MLANEDHHPLGAVPHFHQSAGGFRIRKFLQYRIMDGTNFNGPGFLKLIQWFIELNIDMYRTFVFSQGILERLIDLEVKIPRLMDRPFVYIITGFDVISIYVLLSNRLSVPLINQMRRSICGKNHKGNI